MTTEMRNNYRSRLLYILQTVSYNFHIIVSATLKHLKSIILILHRPPASSVAYG